jgi:hypothetical protein
MQACPFHTHDPFETANIRLCLAASDKCGVPLYELGSNLPPLNKKNSSNVVKLGALSYST